MFIALRNQGNQLPFALCSQILIFSSYNSSNRGCHDFMYAEYLEVNNRRLL